MEAIIKKLTFASQIEAQNNFVSEAPNRTFYEKYMVVDSAEDFDFCKKFEGQFGIFMRKAGARTYTDKYMGFFSDRSFADFCEYFANWYKEHFLENKDNVHHYDVKFCEEWLKETEEDEYAAADQIAEKKRILETVKNEGTGYYSDGAYRQLLKDGETITSFEDDNETYFLGFEIDLDCYEDAE